MRNLNLSNDAAASLTALAAMEAKLSCQIWNKIVSLMIDPRPNDSIDIGQGFFRTSVGEYWLAYNFHDKTLFLNLVGKRNDGEIYKRLKRR